MAACRTGPKLPTIRRISGREVYRQEVCFPFEERGKIADLVLLEANPLEDIANTSRIAAVVLRGKLIPKTSLEAMMANSARMAYRN